ncbi:MAG: hypothetical protein LBR98_10310 [Syntrophomonadaceae bacterium]|nr:hypothetical protein [Syntrophomonadaceae bacterium]
MDQSFDMAKKGYKAAYDVVVDSLALTGKTMKDIVMDVWSTLDGVKKSNLIDFYVQNRETNFYITPQLSAELSIDLFTTQIYNTFVQQIAIESANGGGDDGGIFFDSDALTFDDFIDIVYDLLLKKDTGLAREGGLIEVAYFRDNFRYLPSVVPVSVFISEGTVSGDNVEYDRLVVTFVIGHGISFDPFPDDGGYPPGASISNSNTYHHDLRLMQFAEDDYFRLEYFDDGDFSFWYSTAIQPYPKYMSFVYSNYLNNYYSYDMYYTGTPDFELETVFSTLDFESELFDLGAGWGDPGLEYIYKYYTDPPGTDEHVYFSASSSRYAFHAGIPCNISGHYYAEDGDFVMSADSDFIYDSGGEFYILNPFESEFNLSDFDIMQDYTGDVNYYQYFYNTENYYTDDLWLDELKSIIDGAVKETVTYNSTITNNYYSEYNTINNEVVIDLTPVEHKLDSVLSNQAESFNFLSAFKTFAEESFTGVLSAISLLQEDIGDMFQNDVSPRLDILHDDLTITNDLILESIEKDSAGIEEGLLRDNAIVYIVFCILGVLLIYVTIRFLVWLLNLLWSFIANFFY